MQRPVINASIAVYHDKYISYSRCKACNGWFVICTDGNGQEEKAKNNIVNLLAGRDQGTIDNNGFSVC